MEFQPNKEAMCVCVHLCLHLQFRVINESMHRRQRWNMRIDHASEGGQAQLYRRKNWRLMDISIREHRRALQAEARRLKKEGGVWSCTICQWHVSNLALQKVSCVEVGKFQGKIIKEWRAGGISLGVLGTLSRIIVSPILQIEKTVHMRKSAKICWRVVSL